MSKFHVHLFSGRILPIASFLLLLSAVATADVTINEAAKALPDKVDSFNAKGSAQMPTVGIFELMPPEDFGVTSHAARAYGDQSGSGFTIDIIRTGTAPAAYALLTRMAWEDIKLGEVGIASIVSRHRIAFYKGDNVVQVWPSTNSAPTQEQLLKFAQSFAATLPSGDEDIPVLVQHLPNWQTKVGRSAYAVTLLGLKNGILNQPVLDALNFEGGTEAVSANYGQSQLVIVEFTTPQFSIENDQRVAAKIQELKSQGQSVPSAYRRVGNYSVFVFNAADEKTANELIDSVKYEKVVQWLGEDPHLYERFQRYLAQTSAGVLGAVLKSSGISLLVCVSAGTLFGALLFRRRRARQAAAYSDAGGAIRLNLDELTGTSNSHRLLGPGKQPESDSTQS
jgi:hypothetical protein